MTQQRNGHSPIRTGRVTEPLTQAERDALNAEHDERRYDDEPVEGGVLRTFSPRHAVFIPEGDPRLSQDAQDGETDDGPTQTSSEVLDELLTALSAGEDIDEELVEFLDEEDREAWELALDEAADEDE
jgi:hypothetical protein